jgi:hypothetical protein
MESSPHPIGSNPPAAEEPLRKAIEEFSRTHEAKFAEWIAEYPVAEGYSATAKRDAIFLIVSEFFQWVSSRGYQPTFINTRYREKRRKKVILRSLFFLAAFLAAILLLRTDEGRSLIVAVISVILMFASQGGLWYLWHKYIEKRWQSERAEMTGMLVVFGLPLALFRLLSFLFGI